MKWHIITLAILLITVSCSKEKQTMSNGLVIEDIKIGDELTANYNLYTYPKTGVGIQML